MIKNWVYTKIHTREIKVYYSICFEQLYASEIMPSDWCTGNPTQINAYV